MKLKVHPYLLKSVLLAGIVILFQGCDTSSDSCSPAPYHTMSATFRNKVVCNYGKKLNYLHTDSATHTQDTLHLTVIDTTSFFYALDNPDYNNCPGAYYEAKRFVLNSTQNIKLQMGIRADASGGTYFYLLFQSINFQEDANSIPDDPNIVSTFIQYNSNYNGNKIKVSYSITKGITYFEIMNKSEKWELLP